MKIIVYLTYAITFTYCYYFINRKLANKWILMGYPLFFVASIYPIKLVFDAIANHAGRAVGKEYLLLMLFAAAMLTLFNFMYGIVNLMVNAQAGFQQRYNPGAGGHVQWFLSNVGTIKGAYQLFFYSGGVILYAIVVWHAKI